MTWRVLGKPIYTADNSASAPGVYQKIKLPSNLLANAFRVMVAHYNNPTYTSLELKIYGNRNGAIGKLLHTSTNTITKATIAATENHSLKETYFEFSPEIPLKAGEEYFASIFINGAYVGDSSTHIAFVSTWPDPIFDTGITQTQAKASNYPLRLSIFGTEFP
jgi:hypothetical protein